MTSIRSRVDRIEKLLQDRARENSPLWKRTVSDALEAMRASVGGSPSCLPTKRWYPLRPHEVQSRLWNDDKRFKAVPAGRRSGKTELAKRHIIIEAIRTPGWYVCAAPVENQARRIYWQDLKDLIPKQFVSQIKESGHIHLVNGSEIQVMGLDVPQRIEGKPLAGIILDEYGNMDEVVWPHHVRPALADSRGWAWCIGVPEGRNHYYELCERAKTAPNWGFYTWWSEDILPADEIEELKQTLDDLTFEQEMRASFNAIRGRIYYPFDRNLHGVRCSYNPNRTLVFCFDFNVEPGVCAILQEQEHNGHPVTAIIKEVWIPRDSNTPTVCRKLVEDWSHHNAEVHLYGDPAGGARSTKTEDGSDWDIITTHLRPVFGERLRNRVALSAPRERVRVNSVNARLRTKDGQIHLIVDPSCKHVIDDFESVKAKEGTNGEIDKSNLAITHLTDAIGYYIYEKHPIRVSYGKTVEEFDV